MTSYLFILYTLLVICSSCIGEEQFSQNVARILTLITRNDQDIGKLVHMKEMFEDDFFAKPKEDRGPDTSYTMLVNPRVNTTSGIVEGTTTHEAHTFYEIPYAEPPIGNLRFQPPIPLKTPRSIDAKSSQDIKCHQFEGLNCIAAPITCGRKMTEDCLLLDVFVPNHVNLTDSSSPRDAKLPVMLYIHGGSFVAGSKGNRGKELANATNTIVVVINYRLGPFGFLVHKEAGRLDIEGNQGLKDQQLAMQWVQDNIGNFGGDREKVTLFGNSAGAQSVMFHTLSTISKPMYLRAIQQSSPAMISYQTPDESLEITNYLTSSLCNESISERDCLMNAKPIDLVNKELQVRSFCFIKRDIMGLTEPFRPVIDGVEFTDQPFDLYKNGKWNSDKSMIIGVNTEELEDIPFYIPEIVPTGKVGLTIGNYYFFGVGLTDTVGKKYEESYPLGDDGDYTPLIAKEMTHMYFICPNRAMARFAAQSTTNGAQVYFYANEHPVLDQRCMSLNTSSDDDCYLATHAAEINYVFRIVEDPTPEDEAVTNLFSTYWGSFARTGSPSNGLENSLGDFTPWPEYYPQSWQNMRIKALVGGIETGYEEDICDFWDTTGYYMDPISLQTTPTATDKSSTIAPVISTTSGSRKICTNFLLILGYFFIWLRCT